MITRKEALEWWRNLSDQEKITKAQKHFPDRLFILIATSSSSIEQIFRKELEKQK
jgi:hypothetical protein